MYVDLFRSSTLQQQQHQQLQQQQQQNQSTAPALGLMPGLLVAADLSKVRASSTGALAEAGGAGAGTGPRGTIAHPSAPQPQRRSPSPSSISISSGASAPPAVLSSTGALPASFSNQPLPASANSGAASAPGNTQAQTRQAPIEQDAGRMRRIKKLLKRN